MPTKKLRGRPTQDQTLVVRAAMEVFLSKGYDVSLDEIARESTVARQTLYNRFKSKEGLFRAVVEHMAGQFIEPIEHFEIAGDVRGSLRHIGKQYLAAVLSPQSLAINRLVVTQAPEFPDLAKALYEASTKVLLVDLAHYLQKQNAAGTLKIADAQLAAEYFLVASTARCFCVPASALRPIPPNASTGAAMTSSTLLSRSMELCQAGKKRPDQRPDSADACALPRRCLANLGEVQQYGHGFDG